MVTHSEAAFYEPQRVAGGDGLEIRAVPEAVG